MLEGNVLSLPFDDDKFDIVTAFETVYFWPDIEKAFGEVKRVLKPGGIFLIGMESNGSDNLPMKISQKLIDMTVYNDRELTQFLENNGYGEITVYLRDAKTKRKLSSPMERQKGLLMTIIIGRLTDKLVEWMIIVAKNNQYASQICLYVQNLHKNCLLG